MKKLTRKPATRPKLDATAQLIATSLRQARGDAVKQARMHRAPIIYLSRGKLVSERP